MVEPTALPYDYWAQEAINRVYKTYGDRVSVEAKGKSLLKFGANDSLSNSSKEMIWSQGGLETLPSDNDIAYISSSDNGDTQDYYLEGHTISGANLTFVSQTGTLVGQTKTAISNSLARSTRLRNIGSTEFAGDVYVYEDDTVSSGVPDTASKIHLKCLAGESQTQKCATSISSQDYWFITQGFFFVNKKQVDLVDFVIEIKSTSESLFYPLSPSGAVSNGASPIVNFRPYLIVPKNHDVRITGISNTGGCKATAWLNGMLALVV